MAKRSFKLLITDDDQRIRETLREIFEPSGFEIFLAASGEEALDIVRALPIHLALLDQHLPRMTGIETLRVIRQIRSLLPVILLTADTSAQLVQEATTVRAFSVLNKPFSHTIVISTVQRALDASYPGHPTARS